MSTFAKRLSAWFVPLSLLTGCTGEVATQPLGTERAAESAIPDSGFVPYPIKYNNQFQPVLGNSGQYLPGWDGSVADLIAADAYALCTLSGDYESNNLFNDYPEPVNDLYLEYLHAKMGEVICAITPDPNKTEYNWWYNRSQEQCNIDPRSGKFSKIDDFTRDPGGYGSLYSDLGQLAQWGLSGNSSVMESARRFAALEINAADVNLCMAQYMREQVNGGQSLFTTSTDLTEILALIRERAQLSSVSFGLLAKIASSDAGGSEPTSITNAENDWMVLVRRWLRDVATPEELARIGEDFATAVRLSMQSTRDLAAVLQRSAGQRPVGVSGTSRTQRDWGVEQPRIRLMNLLYGGDPLGNVNGDSTHGRGFGGAIRRGGAAPFVSVDMRDPRLGTLIGLARAADALDIRLNVGATGPHAFDVETSAERLYQSIEVGLRVTKCHIENPQAICDPVAIRNSLPGIDSFHDYDVWQKHLIEPATTVTLMQAFAEAFAELETTALNLDPGQFDGVMHLIGHHGSTSIDGSQWVHIDQNFGVAPLAGHELGADYARLYYLPESLVLDASPYDQGFAAYGPNSDAWDNLRQLGAVPALSFVREALVEGSSTDGGPASFFAAAADVLPEIEREIGPRSVIIRPELEVVASSCPGGGTCQYLQGKYGTDGYLYRVSSTTHGDDPLDELVTAPYSPQLQAVAVDPHTVGFDGVSRQDLDSYATVDADTVAFPGYGDGYEKRDFSYESPDGQLERQLLKGVDPNGNAGDHLYMTLAANRLNPWESLQQSFGGELNAMAEKLMRVLPGDWSRPAFDAFGLPADWVPPADASLVGGNPGEQSYTYYLGVAKQAAQEATTAVQSAIDNLVLETEEQVDLDAAEQRAQTIAGIETAAICGKSESCVDIQVQPTTAWLPNLGDCSADDLGTPLAGDAQAMCEAAMSARDAVIPSMRVTNVAYAAFIDKSPSFSEYSGSELQGLFVRQWNSMNKVALADKSFLSQARALGTEIEAVDAQLAQALDQKNQAQAEIDDAIAALDAEALGITGQIAALEYDKAKLANAVGEAYDKMNRECSNDALVSAYYAGKSYTNVGVFIQGDLHNHGYHWDIGTPDSKSWSPGPMYAQGKLCDDSTAQYNTALANQADLQLSIDAQEHALNARTDLTDEEKATKELARTTANSTYTAALASAASTKETRWAQVMGSLSELQAGVGEVLASIADFAQLGQKLDGVKAQEALETDLAQKHADARFGIQRKFRSYDMWRARALLESARRLAVAARRAVESHFVVDLSELSATQAFVESPALWADEIYGSDLDAPSVVGLSAAPKAAGAIYPNKLIDYVENLERFVQGYTVSYPTSLAEPDTEVLTLPGPDARATIGEDAEGGAIEIVSPTSTGWTFYCPDAGAWLPNPGVGEQPLVDTVDTLCGVDPPKAPTRARYVFSLDPWGRLGGAIAIDPLKERHNVRWTRLAVNLVGTGIRDCQRAGDPSACYAEPFLRYDLEHVGPAWTTNYAEEWRAFNLPTALIESAKALATEEWLDPLTNSWSTSLVANAARTEFFGRSVGGSYTLELELGPEVRLSRIERVQILEQTEYWVRQH